MIHFGLLGLQLKHSFSKSYFNTKFKRQASPFYYENFEITSAGDVHEIIENNKTLIGLNVTFPFKEKIMSFLDEYSSDAKKIGAVNTIKIFRKKQNYRLKGFNTDTFGFEKYLENKTTQHALILGSGGASKAVQYVCQKHQIGYTVASRQKQTNTLLYEDLKHLDFSLVNTIVHCTPLGTFPNVDACVDFPFKKLNDRHFVIDLIYNPSETLFLRLAKAQGATTLNGLKMLEYQAEKSWEIWNNSQF